MTKLTLKIYCMLMSPAHVLSLSAYELMPGVRRAEKIDNRSAIIEADDVIFKISGDIFTELDVKSSEGFRRHAVSATRMIREVSCLLISSQYHTAKKDTPSNDGGFQNRSNTIGTNILRIDNSGYKFNFQKES